MQSRHPRFLNGRGAKYKQRRVLDYFYGDLEKAGIDTDGSIDLHALRKTFITSLARKGVHPGTAQKLAGHKTLQMTMNVYTEISEDLKGRL